MPAWLKVALFVFVLIVFFALMLFMGGFCNSVRYC